MAMVMKTLVVMVAMLALVPQGRARHFLVQTGEEGGDGRSLRRFDIGDYDDEDGDGVEERKRGPDMKTHGGDYSMVHPGEDMMDMAAMKEEIRKMRELGEIGR